MSYPKILVLVTLLITLVGCSSKIDRLPDGERLNLPTSESVQGMYFVDSDNGFVATEAGDGYMTADGGKSFTKLNLDNGRADGFCFLNDDIGFAFGRSGFLARTEDGGTTWTRIGTDSTYYFHDMAFLDKGHGYLVGETVNADGGTIGIIGTSTDKGLTWGFKPTDHRGFKQIHTSSPNHIWILGVDGVTYSVDKGATWEHNGGHGDTVRTVVFSDIIHGWSVGDKGLLRNTSDGGWSWTDKPRLTNRNLACLSAPETDVIFLGGDRLLGMTTNHGRVWLIDSLNYMTTFTKCQVVGKDIFFAGSGGTIIRLKR